MSKQNKNAAFQMIADIDGDFGSLIGNQTPDTAPILPVRNLVLFPGVVTPILIGRASSKQLVQKAEKKGTIICQSDEAADIAQWQYHNHRTRSWQDAFARYYQYATLS